MICHNLYRPVSNSHFLVVLYIVVSTFRHKVDVVYDLSFEDLDTSTRIQVKQAPEALLVDPHNPSLIEPCQDE